MWSSLNDAVEARAAVPGRAEGDLLGRVAGVGVVGVVGRDEVGDVDEVARLGRLAGAGVAHVPMIAVDRVRSSSRCHGLDRRVKMWAMDLTYPAEAEAFRKEIRAWLEDNLPAGWFDEGFEMSPEERAGVQRGVAARSCYDGGWICATWPKEYGGKGLSTMEGVVLAEEFARAKAPMRADFFGDTLVGPTILQWGTEEQKQEFLPKILDGDDALVPGLQRAQLRLRPGQPEDVRRARRRRVGHQRPEGVDDRRPPRRLLLPAHPHRSRRAEAQGHLLPARADAPARRRGARHHPARRHGRVLRGVLHRRPLPEGQRRRRRQQRLEGRQLDARRSSAGSRRPPATGASRRSTDQMVAAATANGADRRPASSASGWSQYYTKIQILRINGLRSLSATLSRHARTWASIALGATNKMFWSEMHQEAMELALDIFGADVDARRRRPGERLVAGRAARQAPRRLPGQPDDVVVLLLPLRDDLGRHQPDPAQHRRRARPRPPQGTATRVAVPSECSTPSEC